MFLDKNDPRRETGLIWLNDELAQKPATHVLIIGVGAYQSKKFRQPLTSTTISARAVADFFVGATPGFSNPKAPLGSVGLLLSEPPNGGAAASSYGGGPVPRATFAAAKT